MSLRHPRPITTICSIAGSTLAGLAGTEWHLLAVAIFSAIALRFVKLDAYALNAREGEWAHHGWTLFVGKPLPTGEELPGRLPALSPPAIDDLFPVWRHRRHRAVASASVAGIGIVLLILALAPRHVRWPVFGMVEPGCAVSPTLVSHRERSILPSCCLLHAARPGQRGAGRPNRRQRIADLGWAARCCRRRAPSQRPRGNHLPHCRLDRHRGRHGDRRRQDEDHSPGPISTGVRALWRPQLPADFRNLHVCGRLACWRSHAL